MTIAELINILQTRDPDELVMIEGYEGGYDFPRELQVRKVRFHGRNRFSGRYLDEIEFSDEEKLELKPFQVTVISRRSIHNLGKPGDTLWVNPQYI